MEGLGIIGFIIFVVIFGTITSRLFHIKKNTKVAADTLETIRLQLAHDAEQRKEITKALQWIIDERSGVEH